MMRRCGSISSPLAALLLAILLVAGCGCFVHGAAAARLMPPSSVLPVPALVHQAENGVKAAADAADGGLALQEGGGVGNGDDELAISELMGAEVEEEACDEGNEDCMQRRLLRDAHLDYIYTQHKGKP